MKVSELLQEAKLVLDFRHENVFKELPYWPKKDDPQYIAPADGFHFMYHEGQLNLASTDNVVYSRIASSPKLMAAVKSGKGVSSLTLTAKQPGESDIWNRLGGKVDLKSKLITLAKEDANGKGRVRVINDPKAFKKALAELKKYGVTSDFKIKGTVAPINGKTVGEVLEMANPIEDVFSTKQLTMYHGTSSSRAEIIKTKGLLPGKTGETYVDLIPGYSEHNVYLATTTKNAEFYGRRQAEKDGDATYVVFKVEVPDNAKILPDDHAVAFRDGKLVSGNAKGIKIGIKDSGSIAYRGRIPAKFISVLSTKKA